MRYVAFRCFAVAAIAIVIATQVRADVTLPTAAQVQAADPGATSYDVVFVTSQGTTATSTNIADYNRFVTAEANQDPILAGLGTSWHAVASTSTVSAASNAPATGMPSLTQTVSSSQIRTFTEFPFSAKSSTTSLTMSCSLGLIDMDRFILGRKHIRGIPSRRQRKPLSGWASIGFAGNSGYADAWIQDNSARTSSVLPLYVLSSPIPIPEPATITVLGTALLGLGSVRLRRRLAKGRLTRQP